MNMLFGLLPCLTILGIILYLAYTKVMKKRTALGLSGFVLFVTAFLSFNTYGPRIALESPQLPYTPDKVEVQTGSQLIPPEDRRGQFDAKLETD